MKKQRNIGEIAESWKASKRLYVKESSLAAYNLLLQKHIVPYFGNATRLSAEDVQRFVVEKAAQGLSRKTIKDIVMVLRMIVRFASQNNELSPASWQINIPQTQEKETNRVLSAADYSRFTNYVRTHISLRNLGLLICLCSGLRIGEVCGLQWDDIDTQRGIIYIRRTIERIYYIGDGEEEGCSRLIVNSPKTESSKREIPLTNDITQLIKALKKFAIGSNYVLTNTSQPLEPRNYRTYYASILKKLRIPKYTFHSLRHSFATRCIETGADYKTVASILGHSSINTTLNLYVHPGCEQKRKCINKMLRTLK